MDRTMIEIKIRETKDGNNGIIITKNEAGMTLYRYYNERTGRNKSSFNKYSFIAYLESLQIPKKYIKQVEEVK